MTAAERLMVAVYDECWRRYGRGDHGVAIALLSERCGVPWCRAYEVAVLWREQRNAAELPRGFAVRARWDDRMYRHGQPVESSVQHEQRTGPRWRRILEGMHG